MSFRVAQRRYNRNVLWLCAAYAIFLLTAVYLFRHDMVAGWPAVVLAILPAVPILGVFAAIGRYLLDEQDEYLRMLMVSQSLVASGLALSVATIWGFLESFALVAHVDAYYIAVLWFFGLGVGAFVNRLIERRA